ncbi:type VI secretion system baseplate subunit TssF [Spirosoma knui]
MLDTRDQIKNRMLREAARQWGYTDAQMETTAFDPLVDLLMGALATESERVYQAVHESRSRILERLVQLLLPEVVTGPRPAHAVMTAASLELVGEVRRDDVMTARHPQTGEEIGLSAAGRFPLVNGRVACLAAGSQLWRIDDFQNRLPIGQAPPHRRLPDYTLWIGLEVLSPLPASASLRFYFDWKNILNPQQYAQALAQSRWFLGDTSIPVTNGYGPLADDAPTEPIRAAESHAQRYYRPQFITLSGQSLGGYTLGTPAPAPLIEGFEPVLPSLPPVVWLRVELSPLFTTDVLSRTDCMLNAFPVLNRQLTRSTFRLTDFFNVFPLNIDRPLLEIADITDSDGNAYIPFTEAGASSREAVAADRRTYALRQQGVGRFDARDAYALVSQVLDQLRDESAAFVAMGYDSMRSYIEDIYRNLQRIRQGMPTSPNGDRITPDPTPFLIVNNAPANGVLFVDYWATSAEKANRLPGGTRVDTTAIQFRREGMILLSPLLGGTPRLEPAASLPVFRQALLTRGRALTAEDIRAICLGTAPEAVEGVTVQKGFAVNADPRQGLTRTLDVRLTFKANARLLPEDQAQVCREITVLLEEQWSGVLPIRVIPAER